MKAKKGGTNRMKDGGAIILIIAGLLTSVQFITVNIIVPYLNNKKGERTRYSKIKVSLSICYAAFFLVLLILDLLGFFEMVSG